MKAGKKMTIDEFKEKEAAPLMEIFDFTSNIPISCYTDTTAVKIPEVIYSGSLLSANHLISEEYLLNRRKSSLDLGVAIGVMRYSAFAARGSIAMRKLAEEEENENAQTIKLPPYRMIKAQLGTVIRSRRSMREMTEKAMKAEDISTILFYGDGVTGEMKLASKEKDILPEQVLGEDFTASLRSAPSGGGLHPVTLYAVIRNADGIEDGIYFYMPLSHALRKVGPLDAVSEQILENICEWGDAICADNINVIIFYVYSLYDNSRKYLDMALDFALIEAGQISENIQLVCAAEGISCCDIGGFDRFRAEQLLKLEGAGEHVINVTIIGR